VAVVKGTLLKGECHACLSRCFVRCTSRSRESTGADAGSAVIASISIQDRAAAALGRHTRGFRAAR
jgi:hypothetical protein